MAKKEPPVDDEPTSPFWMTTYGDMVTLMLTFFILLISYSTIELEKFRGAMESFKGALGIFDGHESPQKMEYINFDQTMSTDRTDLNHRSGQVEELMQSELLQGIGTFEKVEGGVMIRLNQEILFDVGKADLKNKAFPILSQLAEIVKEEVEEIHVTGHTDNVPIHTARFPSNWELSAARALSVVQYFYDVKKIPEKKLVAVGHGEHRPLYPNDSVENRAKNRRVDILVKWSEQE